MKFAIISDIHLGPEGVHKSEDKNIIVTFPRYSEQYVREFIAHVNHDIQPAFVIQLGDAITDVDQFTDVQDYSTVITWLQACICPVYHVMGNHEQLNLSVPELQRLLSYKSLYYSFDASGYHCVILFSEDLEKNFDISQSSIPRRQLTWLKNDLSRTASPSIIFIHHSLADQNVSDNFWFADHETQALVYNREEVRNIIEESGKVIAVFNGHLHWNHFDIQHSIPYFTLQSLVTNFDLKGTPSYSYTVVEIENNTIDVSVLGNDPAHFIHLL